MPKQEIKPKVNKNQISIPQEQFKEIENLANLYSETPNEMVEHLLEAQLQKLKSEQYFYPGLKWDIPRVSRIQALIQKQDVEKLRKWLNSPDRISFLVNDKDGLICLLNENVLKAEKLKETMETPVSSATASIGTQNSKCPKDSSDDSNLIHEIAEETRKLLKKSEKKKDGEK